MRETANRLHCKAFELLRNVEISKVRVVETTKGYFRRFPCMSFQEVVKQKINKTVFFGKLFHI